MIDGYSSKGNRKFKLTRPNIRKGNVKVKFEEPLKDQN